MKKYHVISVKGFDTVEILEMYFVMVLKWFKLFSGLKIVNFS